jgi:diketogulonate reductase-like aldo/keto reductase
VPRGGGDAAVHEDVAASDEGPETLLTEGSVRALGVGNFMVGHATQLIDETMVVRAVSPAENRSRFNPHRADKHSRPEVRVNPRVA